MSRSWFRELPKAGRIEVVRRGGNPEVRWPKRRGVHRAGQILGLKDTLLCQIDPDQVLEGIDLMDRIEARSDWSDGALADALGVGGGRVSRYRIIGVRSTASSGCRN
jgi:hypothetical protein